MKKDGVSYGNKTAYQHHGVWFASNGYVCLVIDTLQLGEIAGIHHGTYREKHVVVALARLHAGRRRGVERHPRARLPRDSRRRSTRSRIGVTGRSGGGAYSWWIAAADDRIKVAVPVAGITDLQNHVVDGCVEGPLRLHVHGQHLPLGLSPTVAALVAPRPLLFANTDKDGIFPLDGVSRLYWKVRGVYGLGKRDDPYHPLEAAVGLTIGEGGHVDSQELQVAAFQWFNRYLKGQEKPDTPIDMSGGKEDVRARAVARLQGRAAAGPAQLEDPRDVRPAGAGAGSARVEGARGRSSATRGWMRCAASASTAGPPTAGGRWT